jgi:hypothetical protein
MCVSLWLILLDVLRQQDGGISAIPPGPQQVPVRTQLKPVAKNGDVFATIVDVAGIVAHDAGQVRFHEQISSSTSSDIRITDREHLLVMGCLPVDRCLSIDRLTPIIDRQRENVNPYLLIGRIWQVGQEILQPRCVSDSLVETADATCREGDCVAIHPHGR